MLPIKVWHQELSQSPKDTERNPTPTNSASPCDKTNTKRQQRVAKPQPCGDSSSYACTLASKSLPTNPPPHRAVRGLLEGISHIWHLRH